MASGSTRRARPPRRAPSACLPSSSATPTRGAPPRCGRAWPQRLAACDRGRPPAGARRIPLGSLLPEARLFHRLLALLRLLPGQLPDELLPARVVTEVTDTTARHRLLGRL